MAGRIAIIVEGTKQEVKYFRSLERHFFTRTKLDIVLLSGAENIYVLWKQLKDDNFETDIIEVMREKNNAASKKLEGINRSDFQEIYLFYDYDPQQDNVSLPYDIVKEMLETFSNETENGKLYISYPMSEALRDVRQNSCVPYTKCMLSMSEITSYKKLTSADNVYVHAGAYSFSEWEMILLIYLSRVKCLYGLKEIFEIFEHEKELNTPSKLYEIERVIRARTGKIFVLSAFPEFIVDYFPKEKFIDMLTAKDNISEEECEESLPRNACKVR